MQTFQKPHPGELVRCVTRWKDNHYFATNPTFDIIHEGEVVNSHPMDAPNTFNILTGRPEFPEAQVALRNVVELEILKGKAAEKLKAHPDHEWRVKGSKGNEYVVREIDMVYTCTCPGFHYRRMCHHISDIIA
jgi:hypothetical protein